MSRKRKKQPGKQPGPMRWTFAAGIPTNDFFAGMPLTDVWHLQEAVENFIYRLEEDRFLAWEAVVCHEQGVPLTAKQEAALDGLINFGDPDDRILYINEMPRPSEPWFVILNKLVPYLLIEPFRTFDVHNEAKVDGWHRIMTALQEHGEGLSLPPDVASYKEIVPADLRHELWLQYCFDILGGLGQADDLTLDEKDPWRVDEFILRLRECKESVAHFGLTLDSLLTKVILPERDRAIFVKLMQQKLGLDSAQESIAERL
jgi:hypothetical protein